MFMYIAERVVLVCVYQGLTDFKFEGDFEFCWWGLVNVILTWVNLLLCAPNVLYDSSEQRNSTENM